MNEQYFLVIDLKSFFASVECVERGLDPMTARLVVADPTRTEKTICLAASPGIKKLGVKNRCRVFEIPKNIDYIMAPPRMQLYLDYSAKIYDVYLKYVAPEDIHVYSVDEAFLDVTHYLKLYQKTAKELAITILDDIRNTLGLYATCGIGTNMYLAKIALDITAKHAADFIGELDEEKFKRTLWDHKPLTDFWMIGKGTVKRLERIGLHTMRDIAMSDEKLLFRLFGVNAELIMDHAWGIETTQISDIKNYKTKSTSISNGQVLSRDYSYSEIKLIVKEMCDILVTSLVKHRKVTGRISLSLGYTLPDGRHTHAAGMPSLSKSRTLSVTTNSNRILKDCMMEVFDEIAREDLYYRYVNIAFENLTDEEFEQYDLFTDPVAAKKDRELTRAAIEIKDKFGKNAILKGMNLDKAGTAIERNSQIGGHRSR